MLPISEADLVGHFGLAGLRRALTAVAFLTHRRIVSWDPTKIATLTAERRHRSALKATRGQPWFSDIASYDRALANSGISPRTRLLYVKAAASLLDHSGRLQARALRQSDIDKFIGTNKGARANLARFGRWLLDARDVRVQMPRRGSSDRIAREKRLLKDVRGLMRMLNTDAEPSARQAYLALAISRLFMIPLSKVVQMEKRDFADDGDRLLLWPEDLRLGISGTLAASFRRVAANDHRYVFPGRGGHRPCSPDSIRHHWTKVEPDRFGLRGSARR